MRPFWDGAGLNSGGERGTATAGGGGVGVLDDELSALQVFFVVDFSTQQVLVAHGVHQQGHAVFGHGGVVFIGDFVEGEAVLKPGATAALHKHAQFQIRVAFLRNQIGHFGSRTVGENNGIRHGGGQGLG